MREGVQNISEQRGGRRSGGGGQDAHVLNHTAAQGSDSSRLIQSY